jgi:hypothetical protein
MSTARNMDELFRRTRQASESVAEDRATAAASTVNVLRELERRLVDALDGDSLRGLSNICTYQGSGRDRSHERFYAAQLAVPDIDMQLPVHKDVLCVDKHGRFVLARRVSVAPFWESRATVDADLRAEWLEAVTQALQAVLTRHLERTERTAKNYRQTAELAEKLAHAVGLEL